AGSRQTGFLAVPCNRTHLKVWCNPPANGTIYQYQAKPLNGSRSINFSHFAGKTVLFVNVATY
uniref:Uncharacterized protein n=1 Tax=Hippocampus comes TaxID=109280 RepID=A0A3Q2XJQ7_HIPCM